MLAVVPLWHHNIESQGKGLWAPCREIIGPHQKMGWFWLKGWLVWVWSRGGCLAKAKDLRVWALGMYWQSPGSVGLSLSLIKWNEISLWAGCQWLMPVILATWDAKIRWFEVWGQPEQIVHETPHVQNNRSKMDWRHGLSSRVGCFANMKPWVQTPVPHSKKIVSVGFLTTTIPL
jgi:hypothetical protein